MEKELMIFKNDKLGVEVRTIKREDGSIQLHLGDVALGLGMKKIDRRNNKEYVRPNISGVNSHLKAFGIIDSELKKDDYIPESALYLLAMKANNEMAIKFQMWLAIDVIPSIRKTGGYLGITDDMSEKEILARALKITERTLEDKNKIIEMKNKQLSRYLLSFSLNSMNEKI